MSVVRYDIVITNDSWIGCSHHLNEAER